MLIMHKKLWGWVVKFEQKINRTIIKEEKEITQESESDEEDTLCVSRQDLPGMMKSLKSSHKPRF